MSSYKPRGTSRFGRRRPTVTGLVALVLGLSACSVGATGPQPAASGTSPTTAAGTQTASPSSSASGSTSASPTVTFPAPGSPTASGPSAAPSATRPAGVPPEQSCNDLVARLSLAERVGQLLMVAVSSGGLTSAQATALDRTHAGSALLLGNSTAGLAATQDVVAQVREAAVRPQRVNVAVAVDQEGGRVQRLAGPGFSDIPSAVRQARLSDSTLTENAQIWGQQLVKAGLNVNLAPVADVVPSNLVEVNEPIGKLLRGYGPKPATVAAKVTAFSAGMNDAGVATAVKHFPGLGRVRGNTDFASGVTDTSTTRDDPGLAGFAAAVEAGVDMVMVSSAVYRRIDPQRQAVFSPTVVTGMIRGDLGFTGVVISDDLSAAAVRDLPPERRAAGFLRAGGDLIIVADLADAARMAQALVQSAEEDPAFAERVDESAARVLALKARRGLAEC